MQACKKMGLQQHPNHSVLPNRVRTWRTALSLVCVLAYVQVHQPLPAAFIAATIGAAWLLPHHIALTHVHDTCLVVLALACVLQSTHLQLISKFWLWPPLIVLPILGSVQHRFLVRHLVEALALNMIALCFGDIALGIMSVSMTVLSTYALMARLLWTLFDPAPPSSADPSRDWAGPVATSLAVAIALVLRRVAETDRDGMQSLLPEGGAHRQWQLLAAGCITSAFFCMRPPEPVHYLLASVALEEGSPMVKRWQEHMGSTYRVIGIAMCSCVMLYHVSLQSYMALLLHGGWLVCLVFVQPGYTSLRSLPSASVSVACLLHIFTASVRASGSMPGSVWPACVGLPVLGAVIHSSLAPHLAEMFMLSAMIFGDHAGDPLSLNNDLRIGSMAAVTFSCAVLVLKIVILNICYLHGKNTQPVVLSTAGVIGTPAPPPPETPAIPREMVSAWENHPSPLITKPRGVSFKPSPELEPQEEPEAAPATPVPVSTTRVRPSRNQPAPKRKVETPEGKKERPKKRASKRRAGSAPSQDQEEDGTGMNHDSVRRSARKKRLRND
eukprot:TRINITY_DN2455_c0_g3_i1.p1 TRINITY_DN2455_c0_g3~~TRINITY_DN2455_c0_g3_i1.p1  ORF type:complete len:555 (+),score=42.83 TRINITY_DN2455_c0_g3_i1:571-2235(+)